MRIEAEYTGEYRAASITKHIEFTLIHDVLDSIYRKPINELDSIYHKVGNESYQEQHAIDHESHVEEPNHFHSVC